MGTDTIKESEKSSLDRTLSSAEGGADNDADWDVVITPKKSLFQLDLKELWQYKDLILLFVRRDLIAIYKQTILGPLWHIVQPLLTTITFTVIFGNIAKLSTNGIPHVLFYMSGIVTWTYFQSVVKKTSDTFIQNRGIFTKVYFPRMVTPISVTISKLLTFGIQVLFFLCFYAYFWGFTEHELGANPSYLLLFPLLVILMAWLGLGVGIIISALTTKYRDLTFLVGFGVQLLMYMSPVIYPISSVSGKLETIVMANPMSPVIETMRFIFLDAGYSSWGSLGYSALCSGVIFFFGMMLFNRVEKNFADTV